METIRPFTFRDRLRFLFTGKLPEEVELTLAGQSNMNAMLMNGMKITFQNKDGYLNTTIEKDDNASV